MNLFRRFLGNLIPKRQYTIVLFHHPASSNAHSLDHRLRPAIEQAGHRCLIWPEETDKLYDSLFLQRFQSPEFLREVADNLGKRPKADIVLTAAYGSDDYNEAVVRLAALTDIGPVMALSYRKSDSIQGLVQAGANALGNLPTKGVDPWVVVTQIEDFLS